MTSPFPEDSAERKTYPMHAVISGYFPAALAKVAHHSHLGNEKHNPGESLHWARGKSDDHLDAAMRHLIEGDLTGAAWRVLAALQLECEANGAPVAPAARVGPTPAEREAWLAAERAKFEAERKQFIPFFMGGSSSAIGGYIDPVEVRGPARNPISQADEE